MLHLETIMALFNAIVKQHRCNQDRFAKNAP